MVRESIQHSTGMCTMSSYSNSRYYRTHLCFQNVSIGESICFSLLDRFDILAGSIAIYAQSIAI